MKERNPRQQQTDGLILGVGFDGADGHTRLTTGENFCLYGGSDETHGRMQEKVIKFNERLEARGKKLGEIDLEEFREIAHEAGMLD